MKPSQSPHEQNPGLGIQDTEAVSQLEPQDLDYQKSLLSPVSPFSTSDSSPRQPFLSAQRKERPNWRSLPSTLDPGEHHVCLPQARTNLTFGGQDSEVPSTMPGQASGAVLAWA